ncbi:MAG: hypothetical protein U1E87_11330 [Alphaproteobacteria bacterium]
MSDISEVDAALHELLMKRAELVARWRMGGRHAAFSPAEDAKGLRDLAARHQGAFPFPALARIWREILSGPVPLDVHVLAPEESLEVMALARAHFGSQASLTRAASAAIVLERVRTSPGAIGLLPVPGGATEKWWLKLLSEVAGAPRVVARLPACELRSADAGAARVLAVAAVAPEPSGEDRTLLAVEADAGASTGTVEKALSAGGHKVHLLDRAPDRAQAFFLFETEGFVSARDLPDRPAGRVHIVGAYPVPLVWPRGGGAGDVVTLRGAR